MNEKEENKLSEYKKDQLMFTRIQNALINRNRMSEERLNELIENNKQLAKKSMQEYNDRQNMSKELLNDIKQEEIVLQEQFYNELGNILTVNNEINKGDKNGE